jgi:hypothetical protein
VRTEIRVGGEIRSHQFTDKQQRQHAIPKSKAPKTPHYFLVQRASGATRYAKLDAGRNRTGEDTD